MTAEFSAGGCERCGKQDHVTYHSWQFLCAECREVLADEQSREHDHVALLAKAEAAGPARVQPRGEARTGAPG